MTDARTDDIKERVGFGKKGARTLNRSDGDCLYLLNRIDELEKENERLKKKKEIFECEECDGYENPKGRAVICRDCYDAEAIAFKYFQKLEGKAKAKIQDLQADLSMCVEALEKLSRLGNEPYVGNSIGNSIAQETLAKLKQSRGE